MNPERSQTPASKPGTTPEKEPGAAPAVAAKAGARPAKPAPPPPPAPLATTALAKVPPLFRRIDWLALAIVLRCGGIYLPFTMSPEVTLEDSGELVTASYLGRHSASAGVSVLDDLYLAVDGAGSV